MALQLPALFEHYFRQEKPVESEGPEQSPRKLEHPPSKQEQLPGQPQQLLQGKTLKQPKNTNSAPKRKTNKKPSEDDEKRLEEENKLLKEKKDQLELTINAFKEFASTLPLAKQQLDTYHEQSASNPICKNENSLPGGETGTKRMSADNFNIPTFFIANDELKHPVQIDGRVDLDLNGIIDENELNALVQQNDSISIPNNQYGQEPAHQQEPAISYIIVLSAPFETNFTDDSDSYMQGDIACSYNATTPSSTQIFDNQNFGIGVSLGTPTLPSGSQYSVSMDIQENLSPYIISDADDSLFTSITSNSDAVYPAHNTISVNNSFTQATAQSAYAQQDYVTNSYQGQGFNQTDVAYSEYDAMNYSNSAGFQFPGHGSQAFQASQPYIYSNNYAQTVLSDPRMYDTHASEFQSTGGTPGYQFFTCDHNGQQYMYS